MSKREFPEGMVYQSPEYYRWYRAKRSEELKAYFRAYNSERFITHRGMELDRRRRWYEENKEKAKAHGAVYRALRDKKLVKYPCVVCRKTVVNAHHEDYSKPLEVVWYCPTHHSARHKELRGAK